MVTLSLHACEFIILYFSRSVKKVTCMFKRKSKASKNSSNNILVNPNFPITLEVQTCS